jgi:hypothetical protein
MSRLTEAVGAYTLAAMMSWGMADVTAPRIDYTENRVVNDIIGDGWYWTYTNEANNAPRYRKARKWNQPGPM